MSDFSTLSLNDYENLTKGVRKSIVKKSEITDSVQPKQGEQVGIYYVGRLSDGTEFDSNIFPNKDKPLFFILGYHRFVFSSFHFSLCSITITFITIVFDQHLFILFFYFFL